MKKILLGLLLVTGLINGAELNREELNKFPIETVLIAVADKMNDALPVKMDKLTTMKSFTAISKELIITYSMTPNSDYTKDALMKVQVEHNERMKVQNNTELCSTPEFRYLLDRGAQIARVYYLSDGTFYIRTKTKANSCK